MVRDRRSGRRAGDAGDHQPDNRYDPHGVLLHGHNQVRGYDPPRARHNGVPEYNRPGFFPRHRSHVPQPNPIRVGGAGDHRGGNRYAHRVKWGYDYSRARACGACVRDNQTQKHLFFLVFYHAENKPSINHIMVWLPGWVRQQGPLSIWEIPIKWNFSGDGRN